MEEVLYKINQRNKLPYFAIHVRVGRTTYSVLLSQSRMNEIGFFPRKGQRVKVEGSLYKSRFEGVDFEMKKIQKIEHLPDVTHLQEMKRDLEDHFQVVKKKKK